MYCFPSLGPWILHFPKDLPHNLSCHSILFYVVAIILMTRLEFHMAATLLISATNARCCCLWWLASCSWAGCCWARPGGPSGLQAWLTDQRSPAWAQKWLAQLVEACYCIFIIIIHCSRTICAYIWGLLCSQCFSCFLFFVG